MNRKKNEIIKNLLFKIDLKNSKKIKTIKIEKNTKSAL